MENRPAPRTSIHESDSRGNEEQAHIFPINFKISFSFWMDGTLPGGHKVLMV